MLALKCSALEPEKVQNATLLYPFNRYAKITAQGLHPEITAQGLDEVCLCRCLCTRYCTDFAQGVAQDPIGINLKDKTQWY
jgi:hypothetical protein